MVELADRCKDMPLCFFLGRGADANVALEGALKLKEIAYIPTQESPAGEMKHGPLALVEPGVVAIFGSTDPDTRDKAVSNMKEIQARGGTVIAFVTEDDSVTERAADAVIRIPASKLGFLSALLSIIPMQLFAYHRLASRGCEIDQPRNLAKSVTVSRGLYQFAYEAPRWPPVTRTWASRPARSADPAKCIILNSREYPCSTSGFLCKGPRSAPQTCAPHRRH